MYFIWVARGLYSSMIINGLKALGRDCHWNSEDLYTGKYREIRNHLYHVLLSYIRLYDKENGY